jgi:hypothetical protein
MAVIGERAVLLLKAHKVNRVTHAAGTVLRLPNRVAAWLVDQNIAAASALPGERPAPAAKIVRRGCCGRW